MKLAKRVSIALLAACVVGGSALTMTACGGSTPEPTLSSDPTPVVSASGDVITDSGLVDNQIDTSSEESASSEGAEQDVSSSVGVDYSGAYLRTFSALPFQSAMKDAVNMTYGSNERVVEIEVLWHEDWDSLKNYSTMERPSESELDAGLVPVGCEIRLDWDPLSDNDPEKFDIYLAYNAQENLLDVVKVNVYFDTDHRFMDQEESLNAVMQMLAILDMD